MFNLFGKGEQEDEGGEEERLWCNHCKKSTRHVRRLRFGIWKWICQGCGRAYGE